MKTKNLVIALLVVPVALAACATEPPAPKPKINIEVTGDKIPGLDVVFYQPEIVGRKQEYSFFTVFVHNNTGKDVQIMWPLSYLYAYGQTLIPFVPTRQEELESGIVPIPSHIPDGCSSIDMVKAAKQVKYSYSSGRYEYSYLDAIDMRVTIAILIDGNVHEYTAKFTKRN